MGSNTTAGSETPDELYSLIDDSVDDRPDDGEQIERGTTWRTKEIYRCPDCHTLTNKVQMGGYPGMGIRIVCPSGADHSKRRRVGHPDYSNDIKGVDRETAVIVDGLTPRAEILQQGEHR